MEWKRFDGGRSVCGWNRVVDAGGAGKRKRKRKNLRRDQARQG
jgi:hypothetical protein